MSTKIQWTEDTWNPIAGCSVVSPGCTNCYAMRRMAPRLAANPQTPQYHGTVQPSKGGFVWTGKIGIAGDKTFLKPLRTRKPTMFFVNSMSDLFHENVPNAVIDRVFAVMALCPQHTFQVLTKRAARMRDYMSRRNDNGHHPALDYAALMAATGCHNTPAFDLRTWPLPNVWLGVSVEDQTRAVERIPDLLRTPAAVRFISAEPLLGPMDLTRWLPATGGAALASSPSTAASATPCLDWIIVGGESGSGARPMHPDWARAIRDQCAAAGLPFFFKQWGAYLPAGQLMADGRPWAPVGGNTLHATKALAGRFLDGVEHNAMPVPGR